MKFKVGDRVRVDTDTCPKIGTVASLEEHGQFCFVEVKFDTGDTYYDTELTLIPNTVFTTVRYVSGLLAKYTREYKSVITNGIIKDVFEDCFDKAVQEFPDADDYVIRVSVEARHTNGNSDIKTKSFDGITFSE